MDHDVSAGRRPDRQLVQRRKNPHRRKISTMNRNLNRFLKALFWYALFDVLVLGYAGIFPGVELAAAQTALTTTTLSAAVNGPAGYNGTTSVIDNCWTLTAVTGISAPTLPGTPVSVIYSDREALGVLTVNTNTKQVCGIRGYLSTQAHPHISGALVLIAPAYNSANGGNPNSSGFLQSDMPLGGACTAANTPTTPMINVLTGAQWLCSSVTGTWAPGWQNPLSAPATWVQTATVASAAGAITPSGPYFNISGTAAITGFNIPVGFDTTTGGCFTANPTGIWTWTAAGNIATAGTTTAATTPVTFCWNVASSKWIPSRLS
jgi:hypothetical protein